MEPALVSTIIPVFNRPAMLRDAVSSVVAQTHRPIEIIIVDDGSTDDTGAVADALALQHGGIVRAVHIPNGGPGRAREAGRALVHGEFVQYLDSDDVLMPRKFELQVAALRGQPDCGAAYGWTRERDAAGNRETLPRKRSGERIETMFPSMLTLRWWDTPTPLYRSSVVDRAGAWTGLCAEEDWEYDCRIAAQGVRLAYVPDWMCEIRVGLDDRLSGRGEAALRDRARAHLLILEHAASAHISRSSPEMQFFSRDLFHLARQCGAAGFRDESRQLLTAAVKISAARDVHAYNFVARIIGLRGAGTVAEAIDRLRTRE
ncbi:MAG TPA: glycosyltransferase family A protein [Thermoanaerobaculia bacterium]|jgi:glycosyltransferase involved in cell wall biosynthesis